MPSRASKSLEGFFRAAEIIEIFIAQKIFILNKNLKKIIDFEKRQAAKCQIRWKAA
jgi:hypothetical protein